VLDRPSAAVYIYVGVTAGVGQSLMSGRSSERLDAAVLKAPLSGLRHGLYRQRELRNPF
jgi:hypothetical protein